MGLWDSLFGAGNLDKLPTTSNTSTWAQSPQPLQSSLNQNQSLYPRNNNVLGQSTTAIQGSSATDPRYQNYQPTSAPQGTGGGGGGGVPFTNPSNDWQMEQNRIYEQGKPTVEGSMEDAQKAFQPIFDELDRRIGGLPGMQADSESQINNLTNQQLTEAETSKQSSLGALDQTRQAQMTQSTQSLRDLAQNTGQLLQSAGNIWSDSPSAIQAVTGNIAKQEGKNRATIMAQRDGALSQIQQKTVDVENLWGTQKQAIQTNRTNQMLEVAKQMRDLENSIRGQRAEIQSNMRQQALSWAQSRIAAIDDQNRQYQMAIDDWKMKRQAALEDYKTQLATQAQYQPQTNYGWDMGKVTPANALQIANITGQPLKVPNANGGYFNVNPEKKGVWTYNPKTMKYESVDENGNVTDVK